MTHRATYTVNAATAAAVAKQIGIEANSRGELTARFNGRTVEQTSKTSFEFYASNADHAAFQRLVDRLTVADAHVATEAAAARPDVPATQKQIAFLSSLIQRDPGLATTVGASRDGARVASGLSKSDASRLICLMLAEA